VSDHQEPQGGAVAGTGNHPDGRACGRREAFGGPAQPSALGGGDEQREGVHASPHRSSVSIACVLDGEPGDRPSPTDDRDTAPVSSKGCPVPPAPVNTGPSRKVPLVPSTHRRYRR